MSLQPRHVRRNAEPSCVRTLLWIGTRRHREFIQPYGIAESMTGQIAYRRSVREAIDRVATDVDRIVIARPDSARPSEFELEELHNQFPNADVAELTGVCCAANPSLVRLSPKRLVPWHRANSFLSEWLSPRPLAVSDEGGFTSQRPSIAVLTASYLEAEGLLQVAEGAGAIGVWCRSADSLVAKNIDIFWWDDSVTGDRSAQRWDDLLCRVDDAAAPDVTHVWLTGRPNHEQILSARSAGVDHVISKPVRVESLVATLGNTRQEVRTDAAKAA